MIRPELKDLVKDLEGSPSLEMIELSLEIAFQAGMISQLKGSMGKSDNASGNWTPGWDKTVREHGK